MDKKVPKKQTTCGKAKHKLFNKAKSGIKTTKTKAFPSTSLKSDQKIAKTYKSPLRTSSGYSTDEDGFKPFNVEETVRRTMSSEQEFLYDKCRDCGEKTGNPHKPTCSDRYGKIVGDDDELGDYGIQEAAFDDDEPEDDEYW
jgi:hypothetical protein